MTVSPRQKDICGRDGPGWQIVLFLLFKFPLCIFFIFLSSFLFFFFLITFSSSVGEMTWVGRLCFLLTHSLVILTSADDDEDENSNEEDGDDVDQQQTALFAI